LYIWTLEAFDWLRDGGLYREGRRVIGETSTKQPDSGIRTALPSEGLSVEFAEQLCPGFKPRLASRADGQVTRAVMDE
jgi:hypothetical protein